jgi:hypothetical protein
MACSPEGELNLQRVGRYESRPVDAVTNDVLQVESQLRGAQSAGTCKGESKRCSALFAQGRQSRGYHVPVDRGGNGQVDDAFFDAAVRPSRKVQGANDLSCADGC